MVRNLDYTTDGAAPLSMPQPTPSRRELVEARLNEYVDDYWSRYSKHKKLARVWRGVFYVLAIAGAGTAGVAALIAGGRDDPETAAWLAGISAAVTALSIALNPTTRPAHQETLMWGWRLLARRTEAALTFKILDDAWVSSDEPELLLEELENDARELGQTSRVLQAPIGANK